MDIKTAPCANSFSYRRLPGYYVIVQSLLLSVVLLSCYRHEIQGFPKFRFCCLFTDVDGIVEIIINDYVCKVYVKLYGLLGIVYTAIDTKSQ